MVADPLLIEIDNVIGHVQMILFQSGLQTNPMRLSTILPMKKTFALVLSMIFIGTALAIPAFGAVKAGASCTKAGSTSTSAGKTFTCVKSGKKLLWDKGVTIAKPASQPSVSPSPTPEQSGSGVSPVTFLNSPEPLNNCRVPDARKTKMNVPQAITYPVTSGMQPVTIPNTGAINVAIIPIDFSDVPGTQSPASIIDPEIAQSKKWIEQFSNGKSTYNFQTTNKWIRAAKASNFYIWTHPGHSGNPISGSIGGPERSAVAIATELMQSAEKDFDYRNLNIVFFVYPKNVVNIYDAVTQFGPVQTNIGTVNIQINATGAWLYQSNFPIWAWFIHENMHPTGLAGHAPNDGSTFNIMTNQAGASLVLDTWDQATLDWQAENEIYCVSKENLTMIDIPIQSLESLSTIGTKAIFLKLSPQEVLVIESRKYDYWSQGWNGYPGLPKDFHGLLVYLVNTSVDMNRVESTGGFAVYQTDPNLDNGIYRGPYSPEFKLNSVIKEGQVMQSSGISIKLLKAGETDIVRISKN
jgi:hypothetical protein